MADMEPVGTPGKRGHLGRYGDACICTHCREWFGSWSAFQAHRKRRAKSLTTGEPQFRCLTIEEMQTSSNLHLAAGGMWRTGPGSSSDVDD